jgi:hypothetical protein
MPNPDVPRFRRPFHVDPPIPAEDQEHFTKRNWDQRASNIDNLWTVEDFDGDVISSHATEDAARAALAAAERNMP